MPCVCQVDLHQITPIQPCPNTSAECPGCAGTGWRPFPVSLATGISLPCPVHAPDRYRPAVYSLIRRMGLTT